MYFEKLMRQGTCGKEYDVDTHVDVCDRVLLWNRKNMICIGSLTRTGTKTKNLKTNCFQVLK